MKRAKTQNKDSKNTNDGITKIAELKKLQK
jgi:hypothetical protein